MKRNFLFLFLLFSFFSNAQSDTVDLTPVEVRSVRAGATSPFTKTNLNKATIEKSNLGQDLPFLLNTTPSVVVFSDAGNGVGYAGLRIRGTDASRINVTLNGVPFNDAESGGTFFVDLPDFISSVNSLQVQRGVGTSSNGAGAFGASINLSTGESFSKPYVELNTGFGSFNTLKNTIRAGTGLLAKHFTTDLRLSGIRSDGFIDRASSKLKSVYFSTAYTSEKTSLRLNIFSGGENTYQAWNGVPQYKLFYNNARLLNHYYNNLGTAYFTPSDSANLFSSGPRTYNQFLYKNQTDNYTQTHYQLFYNRKLFQNLILNTGVFLVRGKGYYEEYKPAQDYAGYGVSYPVQNGDTTFETDLVRQLWLDNYFYGMLFSAQHKKGKTELTTGGALTNYDGHHYGKVIWAEQSFDLNSHYYDLNAAKKDANVYVKWQQNLSAALQLFTDVQWRYVQHRIAGFKDNPNLFLNQTYNFFNPKLGLSYTKKQWFLYSSYSIAHKEPNRDDFEAGKTERPKPEMLRDLEIGVQRKNAKSSISATFYYMNYKDQLVLTGKLNDVGAYTRTNIARSYRAGVELEGAAVLKCWLRVSGNVALSRNRINDFNEYIDDYDNGNQKINRYNETAISFSPAVVSSAVVSFLPVKNVELNFITKQVSKQYLDNTENEARRLNAYATQDVKAVYSFTGKHFKNLMLLAQASNVFNKHYEPNGYTFSYFSDSNLITENYYYPATGTNYMIGVNVRF